MITSVPGLSVHATLATTQLDTPTLPQQADPAVKVLPLEASDTRNQAETHWPNKRTPTPGVMDSLEAVLEQINGSMQAWSTGMRFDMDEEAQRLIVSVVDNQTGEVLRTVPSDAVIQIAKMIVQLQGNVINTQA